MKIGLNATCLSGNPSGANQRFFGIYRELIPRLPHHEFYVYLPSDYVPEDFFYEHPNIFLRSTPLPSRGRFAKLISSLGYWREACLRDNLDILECFNLPIVKVPSCLSILTIHDLRGIYSPIFSSERVAYAVFMANSIRRADHIITVSNTMKDEILRLFPRVPISVIHNGINPGEFCSTSETSANSILNKYNIPPGFILAVGHLEERKNYNRLLDAIIILQRRGIFPCLIIVGNDGGIARSLHARIESAGLTSSVRILSNLSSQELTCLYQSCKAFVFPSSYEGFGIPVLEAMAAHRPMVLSDIPVFRELTENNAIYFDHTSPESIALSLQVVLQSPRIAKFQTSYGNHRIHDFSFPVLSLQLEKLYKSLLNPSRT